ncbi:Hypothetical predicted protein [Xyrichtys novacula]|uniref:Uncharacterized protein n=1 Tax=Xyrichtys novacula TaxID=13765 RepID=A0AAV1F3N0_XYRNO|nr:Hypothetical predicted protein [Xyrichtys novacula]
MGKGGRNVRSHLPTASRDTQTTGPSRAEPCRSCPGRAEPDSLRLIGRDLFSLFAVAPASYDTLWKGGKCASVLKRRGEERRGAPLTVSEVLSDRSADVGSALCVCACVCESVSQPQVCLRACVVDGC